MIEISRVCVKTAGRDSGLRCVVVDFLDDNYVLVDGETRRKKANVRHLRPTASKVNIKKGAAHSDVVKELKKIGIEVREKKEKKEKKATKVK